MKRKNAGGVSAQPGESGEPKRKRGVTYDLSEHLLYRCILKDMEGLALRREALRPVQDDAVSAEYSVVHAIHYLLAALDNVLVDDYLFDAFRGTLKGMLEELGGEDSWMYRGWYLPMLLGRVPLSLLHHAKYKRIKLFGEEGLDGWIGYLQGRLRGKEAAGRVSEKKNVREVNEK